MIEISQNFCFLDYVNYASYDCKQYIIWCKCVSLYLNLISAISDIFNSSISLLKKLQGNHIIKILIFILIILSYKGYYYPFFYSYQRIQCSANFSAWITCSCWKNEWDKISQDYWSRIE